MILRKVVYLDRIPYAWHLTSLRSEVMGIYIRKSTGFSLSGYYIPHCEYREMG